MSLTRAQLSTFTDGSFGTMSADGDTLIHSASGDGAQYVYVSMYNQGNAQRDVVLSVGASEVSVRVHATRRSQQVIPGLRLYNMGSGIAVSCRPRVVSAWTLPDDIASTITVGSGAVVHVNTLSFACAADASPLLLQVSDTRRSADDVDPSKGSLAVIELNRVNGSVTHQIIEGGYAFDQDSLLVEVKYGVLFFGNLLRE